LSAPCLDQLYPDLDFPGADYRSLFTPDYEECRRACTHDPSCQFFTWVNGQFSNEKIRHFHCYLRRSSSGQPSAQNPLVGVTSGYSLKPFLCLHMYPDLDFPGADYRSLFTPDYEECRRACEHDPSCQFFTWVNGEFSNEKIRYKCHLKFSWTVPLTPIVGKKERRGIWLLSSLFFKECQNKYFPNTNIPGSDFLSLPAASPAHCQVLCSAHPSCAYFSFESTTCYLKNNPAEMVMVAKVGVTSGLPSRFCQQDKNWLTEIYEGTDLRASDMRFVELDDAESCQRTCNDDSNCQFFSYVNENFFDSAYWRRCYLKRFNVPAPPKVTKLANVVSGFNLKICDGILYL
uniref:Apple domain-containing protein n=1 Tax=Periophthalmus magnuspinnatus TaxID=409849 RepID=A0A3B3ZP74_9GOBI